MNKDEYKAKCQWLSDFYAEAAKTGREMQVNGYGCWLDCNNGHSPSLCSIPENWRLKPEPQKAWVVWAGDGTTFLEKTKENADETARIVKGSTIQEITKPD